MVDRAGWRYSSQSWGRSEATSYNEFTVSRIWSISASVWRSEFVCCRVRRLELPDCRDMFHELDRTERNKILVTRGVSRDFGEDRKEIIFSKSKYATYMYKGSLDKEEMPAYVPAAFQREGEAKNWTRQKGRCI